jgi:hypothetical protein
LEPAWARSRGARLVIAPPLRGAGGGRVRRAPATPAAAVGAAPGPGAAPAASAAPLRSRPPRSHWAPPPPPPTLPKVNTLVMPPEKHIAAPKDDLLASLRGRLPEPDQAQFDDLVTLMEGVASFDFMDLKERMRTNFLPFASGAKNQVRRGVGRGPASQRWRVSRQGAAAGGGG